MIMEIYDICDDCIANGDNVYQEDGETVYACWDCPFRWSEED